MEEARRKSSSEARRKSSSSSTASSVGEAADLEKQVDVINPEQGEEKQHGPLAHKLIFIVMGTAELFFWNAVLCILEDVRSRLYPDYHSMSDTLNAVNNLTNLGVAAYCIYTGAMNQTWILSAPAVLAVCCFALACVTQWAKGLNGVIWYHIINLAAGAGTGLFQTGAFALASALPVTMNGYVSTGQGVSGLVTWIMWTIISNSSLELKPAMWTMMGCGIVVLMFSFGAYYLLLKRPEVNSRIKQIQQTLKEEATNPDTPTYVYLFKQCWRHVFTVWWNFYITLFIFPTIGPLGWNTGEFYNWLIGCFQMGDLVGRYAPNLLPWIVLKPIPLFWTVIARTVLVVFGVIAYFNTGAFWGHKATLIIIMIILSISSGWIASSVFINTPQVIKQQDWVSRVSSMVVCGLLFGIACGLWTARIFTAIAN